MINGKPCQLSKILKHGHHQIWFVKFEASGLSLTKQQPRFFRRLELTTNEREECVQNDRSKWGELRERKAVHRQTLALKSV